MSTMLGGTRFTTEMEAEYRARAEESVRWLVDRKSWPKGMARPTCPNQDSGNVFPSITGGEVEGAFVEVTLWIPAPKPGRRKRQ